MTGEKGEMIAVGATAEIFAWGDNQVLKLLFDPVPATDAEKEARFTQAVYRAGLPAPAVEGVVEVEGRTGIVFEWVEGRCMTEELTAKPWRIFEFGHILAELHAELHRCEVAELPSLHGRLEEKIREATLPESTREASLKVLRQLPDGNAVCHGDFHPQNIIMSPRGPIIIDWLTATRGNPLGDVARTSLLFRMPSLPPGARRGWLINAGRGWLHSIYLRRYLRLGGTSRGQIDAWRPVVAAARFEEAKGERPLLLALAEEAVQSR